MKTTNPVQQAQCPHCQSVFSVSEEEIALALGAVRCGECMKIFNARYHLIDAQHTLAPSAAAKELESIISAANLANASNRMLEQQQRVVAIPTLQEQAEQVTFPNVSADVDPLETKEEEDAVEVEEVETKKISPPFIVGLFLILITLSVAGYLFINQTPPISYAFTDVRLTPSSSNSKKMDVYFKISNVTEQNLPLPNLTIQLLNLSSQPISSEIVMAVDLKPSLTELAAAASHELQASVDRPAIFVQGARIQVHLNDAKL